MKQYQFIQKNMAIRKIIMFLGMTLVLLNPQTSFGQVISVNGIKVDTIVDDNVKIEVLKIGQSRPNQNVSTEKPVTVVNMVITAYTSDVAQTDDSPCKTASGLDVCKRDIEDIVATNFNWLPFGTRVKIPELFGDRVFIVHDRMNRRYTQRLDVWMKSYDDAVKFGKQYAAVEIYK